MLRCCAPYRNLHFNHMQVSWGPGVGVGCRPLPPPWGALNISASYHKPKKRVWSFFSTSELAVETHIKLQIPEAWGNHFSK